MTDRKRLLFLLLLFTPSIVLARPAQCPAKSTAIPLHILGRSQIMIEVSINHSGPYEFMVDTGAQLTIIDPRLAGELNLKAQGSVGVFSVLNHAAADLVKPELIEVGRLSVRDLPVAVQGLSQIQTSNPALRGILGENFLGRFDLLIDYRHRIICLDQTKALETEMRGERIPMINQAERAGELAYAVPILVAVQIQGNGKKGTILKIDSGSNAPMLFVNKLDTPWWLQRNHTLRGNVAGNGSAPMFATMPTQNVKFGNHMTRPIAFLTPISEEEHAGRQTMDGLLPTSLFNSVFISYTDHFVMFDPRRSGD